jgi:hypothetical protein
VPLVGYRIDDRVVVDPEPGRYAAYRRHAAIDGRSDDVFDDGGLAVHPHVFRTAIGRHFAVRDYEVRQTQRGAIVRGSKVPHPSMSLHSATRSSTDYAAPGFVRRRSTSTSSMVCNAPPSASDACSSRCTEPFP